MEVDQCTVNVKKQVGGNPCKDMLQTPATYEMERNESTFCNDGRMGSMREQ